MPAETDLSLCDAEAIRIPGAIQPHGRMALLDAASTRVVGCSDNWPNGTAGIAACLASLRLDASAFTAGDAPRAVGTVEIAGALWDAAAHRIDAPRGAMLALEFEPASTDAGTAAPLYTLAREFLPRLQQATTLDALVELAAAETWRLTGFGRCLVYRFDAQGHGEVLAERIAPGYHSYLGHHFPASDIPAQARELYRLNHIRLIPDANYQPVPLRCVDAAQPPSSIDLSLAHLRSVSPIHLEYMRNMGTLASLSVSIVVGGRLWGLISCHDHAPRTLGFQVRAACEHLGRLLSMQIEAKEMHGEVATRLELRQHTLQIVSHLADSDATLQRLVAHPEPLLRLAGATGAAVVLDQCAWSVGDVPEEDRIHALAAWLADHRQEVFATDQLGTDFPAAADLADVAAGVLAVSISQVHRHLIIWFRPEQERTVRWAGAPAKELPSSDGRIHPRKSFASWQEQVHGLSAPWSTGQTAAAGELRQALIGIVLRRAEEMAAVATELGRVNKELEAFSYTVSHDLRAPMRHIAGFVDLVLDIEGGQLGERARHYLGNVKEAASFAGQMVDALLDFSRMGRAALKRRPVDTGVLVADLVRELSRGDKAGAVSWQLEPGLPTLFADPLLLQAAVRNLLGNAIKYSRGRPAPRITVRAIRQPGGDGLEVEDNGVGFQMQYAGKLFGVFQRLHAAEEFEGTGIGLASVKRIVERHGGTVWARGEVDRGASFGFTLPRPPDNESGEKKNA